MTTKAISCTFFLWLFLVCQARTAQPGATRLPPFEGPVAGKEAGGKDQPKQPAKEKEKDKKAPDKKLTEPPKTDLFPEAPIVGADFPTFFNPSMMGDWPTYFARQVRTVLGSQTTSMAANGVPAGNPVTTPFSQARTVLVPDPSRGAFNLAENGSPRPQDRVFALYNFYGSLRAPQSGPNAPTTTIDTTQSAPIREAQVNRTTTVTTVLPSAPRVNLNREVFGFEKTFFDGRASVELRAPLLQQGNAGGFGANDVGDLTIIGKYAFILDRATGNVLSGGLALTVPTGRSIQTTDGNLHDTLIQPYVGYIWNFDRFYIQGFHSIVVPTDARDVTLAFNDVGVNCWLYRGAPDRVLSFVVPSIEVHVTTPFNHRHLDGPIVVPDMVALTTGVHFGLGRNTTLTLGAAAPVTGPRPFTVEGFVHLNWRW
jgi:hypothetical protein